MAFKNDGKHHHSMVKIDPKDPKGSIEAIRAMAEAFCTDDETPEEKAEAEAELAALEQTLKKMGVE